MANRIARLGKLELIGCCCLCERGRTLFPRLNLQQQLAAALRGLALGLVPPHNLPLQLLAELLQVGRILLHLPFLALSLDGQPCIAMPMRQIISLTHAKIAGQNTERIALGTQDLPSAA